jgi:hypothetical protein
VFDDLALSLGVEPAKLRQCLSRAVLEGPGKGCVDSGGVRVAWNGGRTTIEVYTTIEAMPADLLELP